eukprot:g12778.t1
MTSGFPEHAAARGNLDLVNTLPGLGPTGVQVLDYFAILKAILGHEADVNSHDIVGHSALYGAARQTKRMLPMPLLKAGLRSTSSRSRG